MRSSKFLNNIFDIDIKVDIHELFKGTQRKCIPIYLFGSWKMRRKFYVITCLH